MNKIVYKRIYDLDDSDKQRVLVERLWPRGKSKEQLAIVEWAKDITPSDKLRQDYHKAVIDYNTFAAAYADELEHNPEAEPFVKTLEKLLDNGDVTLTYSVKDVETSHVPTLRHFLDQKVR